MGIAAEYGVAFGWKPELPDHRDQRYSVMRMPLEAPVELPARTDLRPSMPTIYDQGDIGSCTANAIAAAFEYDRIVQNNRVFTPSRMFIYWNERVMEGTTDRDDGAYIRNGVKSVADSGVCDEINWSHGHDTLFRQPEPGCFDEALRYKALRYYRLDNGDIAQLKSCLSAGFPFIFGFTIFRSFFQADTNGGVVPMPGYETSRDGHAVLAVGYDDSTSRFIIRNSWGTDRADAGYYYMPYQYLTSRDLCDDFWTIRTVTTAALAVD
jgi:C1A family cysteine protease